MILKDRILAGTIAGMIAALAKSFPNYILWELRLVKHFYFYIGLQLYLNPKMSILFGV